MAVPVLDATAGGANANSYTTSAEATAYHESRLFSSTWTDADADTRTIALIQATRELDSRYEWASFPTTQEQALQWPRVGILKRGGIDFVDNDVVPPEIKNATAEYARQLIDADRSADSDIETQRIRSLTAGPVSLTFGDRVRAKPVPDAVRALIPAWWGWLAGRGTLPIARA